MQSSGTRAESVNTPFATYRNTLPPRIGRETKRRTKDDRSVVVGQNERLPHTMIRGHQVSPERPRTTGPCGICSAATDDECHAIADFGYSDIEGKKRSNCDPERND